MANSATDYADEWVDMRRAGYSYREIGDKYEFSHERVRQIISIADPSITGRVPSRHAIEMDERAERITAWLNENGPAPRDAVLAATGTTEAHLRLLMDRVPAHLIMVANRNTDALQHFTDEQVFDSLRRAVSKTEKERLAYKTYEELRDAGDPSAQLVIARYGFWQHACDLAGVATANVSEDRVYSSYWTDDDLVAVVQQYLKHCSDEKLRPTYVGYERYQKTDADLPSGSMVRSRFRRIGVKGWPAITEYAQNVKVGV